MKAEHKLHCVDKKKTDKSILWLKILGHVSKNVFAILLFVQKWNLLFYFLPNETYKLAKSHNFSKFYLHFN